MSSSSGEATARSGPRWDRSSGGPLRSPSSRREPPTSSPSTSGSPATSTQPWRSASVGAGDASTWAVLNDEYFAVMGGAGFDALLDP